MNMFANKGNNYYSNAVECFVMTAPVKIVVMSEKFFEQSVDYLVPAIITGSLKADDHLDIVLRGLEPENVVTVVLKT